MDAAIREQILEIHNRCLSLTDYITLFDVVAKVPEYIPAENLAWKIKQHEMPPIVGDYFLSPMKPPENFTLTNKENGLVLMSTTPMELSSMNPCLNSAYGHVVVLGLGLGVITCNLLFNALERDIESVTVVENDRSVIELFYESLTGFSRTLIETALETGKLNIVCHDGYDYIPTEAVDYLYCDTWYALGDELALALVKTAQGNINADSVCWWGAEFDLFIHGEGEAITKAVLEDFEAEHGLPLFALSDESTMNIEIYCKAVYAAAIKGH